MNKPTTDTWIFGRKVNRRDFVGGLGTGRDRRKREVGRGGEMNGENMGRDS